MKGKVAVIFLCCFVLLVTGVTVAYYNTRSYGFDDDVKIIEYDDEKIKFFDFDIYYKTIDETAEKLIKYIPVNPHTI